jgi:raw score 2.35
MKKIKRTIKVKPSVQRISNGVNSPVRKIVQIAMSNVLNNEGYMESMIALCNDGSLWQRNIGITERKSNGGEWFRLNDIPQD